MSSFPYAIEDLPGGTLVAKGLDDLRLQALTPEALLVIIAAPALVRVGAALPALPALDTDAELILYRQLQEDAADPYSSYNALLRELVSFTRACALRVRQAA